MNSIHILFAVLATIRLTQIVVEDTVFGPVRRLFRNWPQVLLFFGCVRCISVWAGVLMTAAYIWFPWAYWPLALSLMLQAWHLIVSLFEYLSDKGNPKITIRFGVEGNMHIEQNKLTEDQTKSTIIRLAGLMTPQPIPTPPGNPRDMRPGNIAELVAGRVDSGNTRRS